MKYTIKSIAEELNLSRNTVAKVLSGKAGVSIKTQKLVLEKISSLEQAAPLETPSRKESSVKQDSVLLLTAHSFRYTEFRTRLIKTLEAELKERNLMLKIGFIEHTASSYARAEESSFVCANPLLNQNNCSLPPAIHDPSVKGVILAGIQNRIIYEQISKLPIPAAVIDLSGSLDAYKGRLDIIALDTSLPLKKAASGLAPEQIQSLTCPVSPRQDNQEIVKYLSTVLSVSVKPKLYLCDNDCLAIELLNMASQLGYRIPEDFSVIGFGDIAEAAYVYPPLTTVQVPVEQLGITVVRCIADRLADPKLPYVYTQYIPSLICRSSACI